MGLVKATIDAVGSALGDQWRDFLTVPDNIRPTAALFPAVYSGTNAGRGTNYKGSEAVVTNGTRIVVPEGYGLLLFQEGELTAFAAEPGRYTWNSEEVNSQSIFAGSKWSVSLVSQSWERFKFGGRPGTQQLALFVSLKELPNNRFGTQSSIYWDDAYLNAQIGVITHGTYSVRITDPIVFAKQFVPATYLQAKDTFDFTDRVNPASSQLFSEVVGALAAAFSSYTNHSERRNRIAGLQHDSIGFAESLGQAVEDAYQWKLTRGLEISKVTIVGIEYDEDTKELLKSVQRADALAGARGNANLQASVAAGLQAAGETDGAGGVLGLGIASGSLGLSSLLQPTSAAAESGAAAAGQQDLVARLEALKKARDAGLIDQTEFEAAKAKVLGLV